VDEATERQHVADEVAARLRDRGLQITEAEDPEDLAAALEAVERFEGAVKASGGDLMVDNLRSSEPEDPRLVLPERRPDETLAAFALRVDEATRRLREG
jgi:hypothetical protein